MRNAIVLHGFPSREEYYDADHPSASNSHWLPWLQNQLLVHNVRTHTPEVFRAFELDWDSWVLEVEQYPITSETTLVGHSTGAGFWVRYLSEHPALRVDKLVLVAPWLNVDREADTAFFDFDVDNTLIDRTSEMVIFASDDDGEEIQSSVAFLREAFPQASFVPFHGRGHFIQSSMPSNQFPELLAALL
jgi:predicted alpha/beta hydrolase family esterase